MQNWIELGRISISVRLCAADPSKALYTFSSSCSQRSSGSSLDAVTAGQGSANRLVEIFQCKPSDKNHKGNEQTNPCQLHVQARMPGPREIRKDIHEWDVRDVEGIGESAGELAKPDHSPARI